MKNLPLLIETGLFRGGHIQGIAVDRERKFLYCSFTTELVKLDMEGNLIGSVRGFTGHLGCLAYNDADGRIYGSLEYKNDTIGKGILRTLGMKQEVKNAFYLAIFDGEKITRPNMNAETDGVMTTVWLREPTEDYLAPGHRFGCSGIDGITFAPIEGKMRLFVAYGIYGDIQRRDNDYQVLLSYQAETLAPYETVLTAENIHEIGPLHCDGRYFVYTGNTTYGVQNLEYDAETGCILAAVYPGKKEEFPNFKLFFIDMNEKAQLCALHGLEGETGLVLPLRKEGLSKNQIYGYDFPYGSTGMISLGGGLFYFSEDYGKNGEYASHIRLYRYTGNPEMPFVKITE